jgi:pyruvate,water dikinase
MRLLLPLEEIEDAPEGAFGGKARTLSRLIGLGFRVPPGVGLGFEAYRSFVNRTGLAQRIHFELNRKRFEDMRWEEVWDASLRIRNMFARTSIPRDLEIAIRPRLEREFGDRSVVVRSSASGEDSAAVSFAGLHESFVNVRGASAILDHIRLVWASMWSDRALLYRKELGLDPGTSAMGIVVQEMVTGDRSGVVFSRSPQDPGRMMVEAVLGLNEGLVDGSVEPDRWVLDRNTGEVVSIRIAEHVTMVAPSADGVVRVPVRRDFPREVLAAEDLALVRRAALGLESALAGPQDVEWTLRDGELYLLQARPITTLHTDGQDDRVWYLSLTRSFENLVGLREKIEKEILPGMEGDARMLAEVDLGALSSEDLAREIERRARINRDWVGAYWRDCIPFAHGMRLFGQFYNDAVRPEDPYEFMDLLRDVPSIGLERNRMLAEIAARLAAEPGLAEAVDRGEPDPETLELVDKYLDRFASPGGTRVEERSALLGLAARMADAPPRKPRDRSGDAGAFLSRFSQERREFASRLLDLARASYRLRDDDNIYLAGVERELVRAVREGAARLGERIETEIESVRHEDVARALREPGFTVRAAAPADGETSRHGPGVKPRQLTGQPAGPGIATGPARLASTAQDIFALRRGEILVTDAIEPEMTFSIPLAGGIVERRGGMLIHGAIVAREYGIPCVTGVPEATAMISPGATVTVDGFLGLVTVE